MTIFELVLALLRQFGLVPPEKLRDLTAECQSYEDSASEKNTTDKVKLMYTKIHFGEYGLLIRVIAMPFIYFYLRGYLKDLEKDDDDLVL